MDKSKSNSLLCLCICIYLLIFLLGISMFFWTFVLLCPSKHLFRTNLSQNCWKIEIGMIDRVGRKHIRYPTVILIPALACRTRELRQRHNFEHEIAGLKGLIAENVPFYIRSNIIFKESRNICSVLLLNC